MRYCDGLCRVGNMNETFQTVGMRVRPPGPSGNGGDMMVLLPADETAFLLYHTPYLQCSLIHCSFLP